MLRSATSVNPASQDRACAASTRQAVRPITRPSDAATASASTPLGTTTALPEGAWVLRGLTNSTGARGGAL